MEKERGTTEAEAIGEGGAEGGCLVGAFLSTPPRSTILPPSFSFVTTSTWAPTHTTSRAPFASPPFSFFHTLPRRIIDAPLSDLDAYGRRASPIGLRPHTHTHRKTSAGLRTLTRMKKKHLNKR